MSLVADRESFVRDYRCPARAEGKVKSSFAKSILLAALLSGCASAGGTAGIFDTGSVWYKHSATGEVKECGGGFYPGVQIRRYNCGKRYLEQGYVEVENCAEASKGTLCVSDAEKRRAEAAEKGESSGAWVLWQAAIDSVGQPIPDQWSAIGAYDSRKECESRRSSVATRSTSTQSALCLPDTVDPRGPRRK